MALTKTMVKTGKVDQEIKPGSLIAARVRVAGNGGCIVDWEHSPEKDSKGPMYVEHRPDAFGSIEEACHAIVQAAGGDSRLEEYAEAEEAKGEKGKAA